MILMQGSFHTCKSLCHVRAGMIFDSDLSALLTNDHMILKKGTGILGYRIDRPASCTPSYTVGSVGVAH